MYLSESLVPQIREMCAALVDPMHHRPQLVCGMLDAMYCSFLSSILTVESDNSTPEAKLQFTTKAGTAKCRSLMRQHAS